MAQTGDVPTGPDLDSGSGKGRGLPGAGAARLTESERWDAAERIEFQEMRDRLVKSESPTALIEIAVLVMVLSGINFLLRPEVQPFFHVLDFAAAFVMLGVGLWLRRPSVSSRLAPWAFTFGMVVLASALLVQVWVETSSGPTYVLILLCVLGPVTLAWGPFLSGAALITAGTALATSEYPGGAVVDWTFLAVSAAIAGAVLLQLRMRSIRSEVRARQALGEEKQRLELVLESSRLGLWDWNMQTDALVCDKRWAGILGYRLEELAPLSIETEVRLVHPQDLAASDAVFDDHRQGRIPFYDMQLRMRHRDGHWVWVHDRGRIVERAADGTPTRMTGTLEDASEAHSAAEKLSAAEEQSRLAMDNSAIGTCLVSTDDRFLRVNDALCQMLGRKVDELLALRLAEVAHPDDVGAIVTAEDDVMSGRLPASRLVGRYVADDGHVIWGDTSLSPVHNNDGSVRHLVVQIVDVSTERALHDSLIEAQRIAHVGSWRMDVATGQMWWSDELLLMFGLELSDRTPTIAEAQRLITAESWERLSAVVARATQSGTPGELELQVARTDGTEGWFFARVEGVRDAHGSVVGLQGVALDITSSKLATVELQKLATHDPLTGLANRTALNDEIALALRAGRRAGHTTAVLMIDLDHFKDVNDTLGHAAGDQLLVAAADRLSGIVRAGDLVARTGGDEFVIVMRDLEDSTEALQAARRVVDGFREPFVFLGYELYATASVGVATSSRSSDAGDLVREADTAMYVAKEKGRDRVSVFNEGLRAVTTARVQVEADLRHAFDRDQLRLWYQPEVDLTSGAMIAVEALLRWNHPDGSIWTADRFVDVAEKTGMILDIGDWVLREACAQAAAWAAPPGERPLTVRVNVSTLQLAETGLLDAIDDALTGSALDSALLCLEITETALLHQTPTATVNLAGIRERGISIAIDDFGTGYASLSYLRDYPIDLLKIDRSFVTHLTTYARDAQIVAGIIALAQALGIEVTAEGVEDVDQAAVLRSLGCPAAQGYLFSRALPPEQITRDRRRTYSHALTPPNDPTSG